MLQAGKSVRTDDTTAFAERLQSIGANTSTQTGGGQPYGATTEVVATASSLGNAFETADGPPTAALNCPNSLKS